MAEYQINKGVDSKVEFQGLTSQYLFLFVGGLGGVFLAFVILVFRRLRASFSPS